MIEVRALGLDGVAEIVPRRIGDARGFFSETWSRSALAEHGIRLDFVQDNQSLSRPAHVLRGLHFQRPPAAQAKLVRVLRGAIFDVAVDIRRGSATFGRWVGLEVSAARGNQILVPEGFAHGFLTLEPDTEVAYKVTAPYSPTHDAAVHHGDPLIGIGWPGDPASFILSNKDAAAPLLAGLDTGFGCP